MNPLIASSIISAGSNLLGGGLSFFGASGANAANASFAQQQLMMQQNDFNAQMDFAKQQFTEQQLLNRQGVQMRVNDAVKAGVSPLVALGMQPMASGSFSAGEPVGGESEQQTDPLTGMERSLGSASQDISRALAATKTKEEKDLLIAKTNALVNEGRLNDAHVNALNAQANFYNSRAVSTPPFPSVGGRPHGQSQYPDTQNPSYGDIARVTTQGGMEYTAAPGTPGMFGGVEGAISSVRNRLGSYYPGLNDARIMADIRKFYPGAVGYKMGGMGQYYPVYPDEEVRHDVENEFIFKKSNLAGRLERYLKGY